MNAPRWRPIKSAPKDGTIILVAEPHPGGADIPWAVFAAKWIDCPHMDGNKEHKSTGWYAAYIAVYDNGMDEQSWTSKPICGISATHWMPMPKPPAKIPKGH